MIARRGSFLGAFLFVLLSGATAAPQNSIQKHKLASARARWQQGAHSTTGMNPADLRRSAIAQKVRMRGFRAANAASGSGWASLGPSPLPSDASGIGLQDYNWIAGRATAIAVDPNDSSGNTVFIGSANGGIWKSSNAGALSPSPSSVAWSSLIDDQQTLAIGALAVQPQASNPNPASSVVLAGSGETNSSADSYYGLGLYRSADGGQTWTLISQDVTGTHSFAGLGFSRIAFSTFNSNLVVAGAGSASEGVIEDLENPVAANRGVYYSNDAGATWNAANVTDLGTAISPASVTSVAFNAASAKFYAAVRYHGFYASFDGVNWLRLATQPGAGLSAAACPTQATQPSACSIYRGEIAVVPGRTGPRSLGEMYVWYTDSNDVDQGIWQSLDGGFSWTQIDDSGMTNCGDLLGGCGTEFASDNLTLAAVPNGAATDLYAGAVNLYKCSINVLSPTCSGGAGSGFINLTHAYGCSNIAKVYPGQHAIDFSAVGASGPMYFANDGGIYRALSASSDLTSGTCGIANQFDSLNATLGPVTQFTSLSQSNSDPNLIFGGTSDNGAPVTDFAQSGGSWANVNAGNIGETAINPSNDRELFISTPPVGSSGVNLFSCPNGVSCHTQDFSTNQVADSTALGGDTGPFRLPFIFDPDNAATLIVGTCKIWRGSSSGGAYTLLSPDFENGGTGVCTGSETNMARAIAAGGSPDTSGNAPVIYAGTNGFGPLVPLTPSGGHVWVTTNAAAGPASWVDETGNINPSGFPISSIAVDPSDLTGQTAYVGIMGFGTSQVWKTTNAGVSWVDFTGNLPAAVVQSGTHLRPPVDSIAVDGSAATIYIGTDIGVFASSTASPNWIEVGPSSSGPGFLPEVPVTSLKIFNSGGLKQLRAATFGRGIWQWDIVAVPDFLIKVYDPSQTTSCINTETIFPGQLATFNGTLLPISGYNSSVGLTCTAGSTSRPQTCAITPQAVSPGVPLFALTAGGTPGDYSFNVHAVGSDPASVTHDFPVVLHVASFNLNVPSPASATVAAGNDTSQVGITISSVGSFSNQVTLSCSGLPTGATCTFQPSNTILPPSDGSIAATMIISTTAATPVGSSPITITAASPGIAGQTQAFSLNVTTPPDYTIAVSSPSLISGVNSPATFNGTLTTTNGYTSAVTLSCGTGAPPTCTLPSAGIVPTAAGAPFTVTVSSGVGQAYSFNINARGSDPAGTSHSVPVSFKAVTTPDYTITIANSSLTSQVNTSVTFNGILKSLNGYNSAVVLSCGNGGPPTCTPNSTSITPSPLGTAFSVTVNSAAAQKYTFNINAVGTDPLAIAHSAAVAFTATQTPDYGIAISNTPLTSTVNTPATFTGTLTSLNGYSSAVTLSCGSGAPPTCTPPSTAIVPTSTGTPFSVTVSSGVAQHYSFNINAVGSDPAAITHSIPVNFTGLSQSPFDFQLSVTPPSVSVSAGQSATYTLDVSPNSGAFPGAVTFSFSALPPLTTCSFNPPQIAAGAGDSVITVTVSTTAAVPVARLEPGFWFAFGVAGLFFVPLSTKRSRRKLACIAILTFGIGLTNVSCSGGLKGNSVGGSGTPGTPTGSYNVNINVSTSTVTHDAQVGLAVTP